MLLKIYKSLIRPNSINLFINVKPASTKILPLPNFFNFFKKNKKSLFSSNLLIFIILILFFLKDNNFAFSLQVVRIYVLRNLEKFISFKFYTQIQFFYNIHLF